MLLFLLSSLCSKATDKAMEDIKKSLTVLNNALLTKTFLVGERVTLADISVACNLLMLYKQVSYFGVNYESLIVITPYFSQYFSLNFLLFDLVCGNLI